MEFANGVLNVKWGIIKKLPLEHQELLEHKSRKTKEIYSHVSTESLPVIKNPLDIPLAGGKTWSSKEETIFA